MKRRGRFCFICGTIDHKENGVSDTFGLIRKPGLKIGSPICGRHFDIADIMKGKEIGGVLYPFKMWKLKDQAIPKHLLSISFEKCDKSRDITRLFLSRRVCFQAPRKPACGSFAHPTGTEEVETDSNCCPMDEVPSTNMEFQGDQVIPTGQGVTVYDIRYGQPLSDMFTPVESLATDAGCHQINEAPALSVADPQSVSDVPVTLHENESSVRNGEYLLLNRFSLKLLQFRLRLLTRVVNLPSKWRWDTVDHSCYNTIISGKEFVHKIVLITNTLLTFFMNGREFIFPFLNNKMTFFAQAKALRRDKYGKGMRYEAVFLLEALMLKMKSNAAFKHLRNDKILPLPSPSTIRKLISSSNCHFGFNELALENIEGALKDFGKVTQLDMFDSRRLVWDGVVNYGSDFPDKPADSLADHALVVIFRPYKLPWIQPISSFATNGAASAPVLQKIVIKAITSLYTKGAISNKGAMNLLKVTAKDQTKVKPYFIHPMDPKIKIWCFFDVPHLLKCVRNHLLTHKRCQLLYNTEKNNSLRRCFRLTEGHIHPKNWQKMTISQRGYQQISLAEEKNKLHKMLHVLNVTEELSNDPKSDKNALPNIKFMSDTTLVAWRLVIHSSIGLIDELFEAGCDVNFFGIVRSIDDHPTAHSWLHIFRILSLYNPTKAAIQNANQCLIHKFRECESEAKMIKMNLKDSLHKELLARYTTDIPDGPSDSTRDQLVYDLCGYLIRTRHEVCETCPDCNRLMETKESEMENFQLAQYTYQRSYGALKYATSPDHIFVRDSYETVLSNIKKLSLIPISCDNHPKTLPYLMMEYVQIRFHFEATRYQNLHLFQLKASIINNKKLSTVVSVENTDVNKKCDN
ncbi:hypothetical protein GHT06_021583 [Daphnia sinensis]|uniref:Transposable element P transposase-like RNase H domain-containing protein n=1 Tax=Daphnia sinensis TaxID=1820382 RepID=A0AAD5KJB4_9CRUS|nr:hypothetical protein GHT06_021583 [Daphnia sinensis]